MAIPARIRRLTAVKNDDGSEITWTVELVRTATGQVDNVTYTDTFANFGEPEVGIVGLLTADENEYEFTPPLF